MKLKNYDELSSLELDTLREIGSMGTGNAATALSQLLGREIRITPPEVRIMEYNEAIDWIGGPEAIGGFLVGNIVTGLLLALLMSNAGGLWDNAKKFVESGNFGGKGSDAHKAAVIGDTVGDPFKDTAGPSINTQITVVSLVSSLAATLFVRFHLFLALKQTRERLENASLSLSSF